MGLRHWSSWRAVSTSTTHTQSGLSPFLTHSLGTKSTPYTLTRDLVHSLRTHVGLSPLFTHSLGTSSTSHRLHRKKNGTFTFILLLSLNALWIIEYMCWCHTVINVPLFVPGEDYGTVFHSAKTVALRDCPCGHYPGFKHFKTKICFRQYKIMLKIEYPTRQASVTPRQVLLLKLS